MAIVKAPALSLDASGNLGGICYSKWRGLAIARDVWTGTVPNTSKQVVQQGYMTLVSQAWGGTLDSDERQTWVDRAKTIVWSDRLGSPYIPSGYQLYMKWNIRRLCMGLSIMKIAPVQQEWVYVQELNLLVQEPYKIEIRLFEKVGSSIVQSYGVEYYKAGPYNSGGRKPIEGEWLLLSQKIPPAKYNDTAVITGKWYWYKGRAISKFGDVQNWFTEQVQFI